MKAYDADLRHLFAPSNEANGDGGRMASAPTDLTTTVVSNAEIDLTWTDNATNETGYEIDRTTDGETVDGGDGHAAAKHAELSTTPG